MSFFVDIHALQTLPPSNINRDDTGSPKSAIFGGVSRQRVSSQAWKSVIRRNFEQHLDRSEIGVRTRQVADMIVDRITSISPEFDPDKAESAVVDAFKAAKISKYPDGPVCSLPVMTELKTASGAINSAANLGDALFSNSTNFCINA